MHRLIGTVFAAVLLTLPAHAQQSAGKAEFTNQQQRLERCNAEATKRQLKERQRQTFISTCLKSARVAAEPAKSATRQDKTAACRKEAASKGLTGDEREKFMSACLKR